MPDGYSVDLDQFHGLNQIGEEGLRDKVNNHYLQIFGTSIALGVVAGAAEATQGGGTITGSGTQVFTNGASASVSQSATTVLDRFMQIPPTITIREGHRVKLYFVQDLLLPAYERRHCRWANGFCPGQLREQSGEGCTSPEGIAGSGRTVPPRVLLSVIRKQWRRCERCPPWTVAICTAESGNGAQSS
jgi:hypothetical protein